VKTLSAIPTQPAAISASADAAVTFERAAVEAIAAPVAAPVEAAPAVAVQAEAVEAAPVPVAEPAVEVAAVAAAQVEVEAPAVEAPAPVEAPTSSGVGAALVGSAYSQIGVAQDCTAMVEKALRSIGKSVGDIAPSDFFAFGSVVSTPAPGDLVVSGGHVAIYVGNGQVISGGLNGMNTGLHSLSDLSGYSFVRVR
jgi:cell wall-associated NlpC family hydrolase